MKKVKDNFDIADISDEAVKPAKKGQVTMYLSDKWYTLNAKTDLLEITDPVKSLDVSLLQDYLLGPVLGIGDPRTDKRIDFIGGIRGLDELKRRADSDMKVSFAMYPTSIDELLRLQMQECLCLLSLHGLSLSFAAVYLYIVFNCTGGRL